MLNRHCSYYFGWWRQRDFWSWSCWRWAISNCAIVFIFQDVNWQR